MHSATHNRVLAFLVLALAVAMVVQAVGLFRQNLLFTRAQTEVSFWGRGDYRPDEPRIHRNLKLVDDLLVSRPAHPDYLSLEASVAVWQAYWLGQSGDGGQAAAGAIAQQAINSQYAALVSRPAHRYSWEKLAEYLSRGEYSEQNATLVELARVRMDGQTWYYAQ